MCTLQLFFYLRCKVVRCYVQRRTGMVKPTKIFIVYLSYVLLYAQKAYCTSYQCHRSNNLLHCTCPMVNFKNCTNALFADSELRSLMNNFVFNCNGGNLSINAYLALENTKLTNLTLIECELTDWHAADTVPDSIYKLEHLNISRSFVQYVFPSFGELFSKLETLTFYENYLHLNNYIGSDIYPKIQPFHMNFNQAKPCIAKASGEDRNCFCEEIAGAVNLNCFGANTLNLKHALTAVINHTGTNVGAISMHHFRFLINEPQFNNDIALIVNLTAASGELTSWISTSFHVDTCEPLINRTNRDQAWQELQSLTCPMATNNSIKFTLSAVNCPQVNALQLVDNTLQTGTTNCGMIQANRPVSIDLSSNNITLDEYVAHFNFQVAFPDAIEFNFSGNYLPNLTVSFVYLINPYNISRLDLSFNNVTSEMPETDNPFLFLPALEWLSLAGNALMYVRVDWFRNLMNLKHLDLSLNYNFNGVQWRTESAYPQIWPTSLEHLNLFNTSLIDANDIWYTTSEYGERITDRFFMGLENLLVLNLSFTSVVLSSELFKPLHSLQALDLSSNSRYITYNLPIPSNLLQYVANLRFLNISQLLPTDNIVYSQACEFFEFTAVIDKIDMARSLVQYPTWGYNDQLPTCDALGFLYDWTAWKKATFPQFDLLNAERLSCLRSNTTSSFAEYSKLVYNKQVTNIPKILEATVPPIAYQQPIINVSSPAAGQSQPSTWQQIQVPIFTCLAILLIVLFLCLPTKWMCPTLIYDERQRDDRGLNYVIRFNQKGVYDQRKELKKLYFSDTLINGFLFAYKSRVLVERLTWYAIILAFTGILIFQIIGLWQQFYYAPPNTLTTLVGAGTFPQNNFTICYPMLPRNLQGINAEHVKAMAVKSPCYANTTFSLPIRNELLRDYVMYRIGAQMAWEGATLKKNLVVTEGMRALDELVQTKNLTYRHLLMEINRVLCEQTQFTASTSIKQQGSENLGQITMNTAGCAHLLSQEGLGLTWYDQVETHVACLRFPGLFNFSGFQNQALISFKPLQFYFTPTYATIDLSGSEYPRAGRSFPANVYQHHYTYIHSQIKSLFLNLESYRSQTNLCYNNCIGTFRVAEIQQKCKCRPLMFADLSDRTLPECSLEMYESCNLSRNGNLRKCASTVPCRQYDYGVKTTDNGLTLDNSTQIRFGGMNTLYVIYQQADTNDVLNLMGNIGGVFGLWLGGSMVAILHIFFFCIKKVLLMIPWTNFMKIDEKRKLPRNRSAFSQTTF